VKLPTTKREPLKNLSDYNLLLYGAPKVGKSTFCSHMEDAFFIATDNGLKSLSVMDMDITSWTQFRELCGILSTGAHPYKTLVIDTVDNLYKQCREHVLSQHRIKHESDAPFGKGYGFVKDEFTGVLTKVLGSKFPYGIVLTSWAKTEEVKTRTDIFHRAVTTLPAAIQEFVTGNVDIILYATALPSGERVLHANSSERHLGGDRSGNAFGRQLPNTLPLDYKEFETAFYGGEIR
jgi:hypothetical protein